MAAFACTRCGKCCMGFGRYVRIERQVSGRDFLCRFTLTGERSALRVEDRYRSLFADTSQHARHPAWCPFLRKVRDEETYVCTVYSTRPSFCRSFICCTMRIFDTAGTPVGSVKGRRSLSTGDAELGRCWAERVAPLTTDDDALWRSQAAAALEEAGYRVEIYEQD
ncbi:MAG: YkgJ family cysteine cluster protein [Methanomicrobiaceae archaeon]|nr:YkgJ family cysteine cluster protein [Methanomicrobiaceae archaeon]